MISITENGRQLLNDAPSPLQEKFVKSFHGLEDWEQLMILSSIERIVSLMSAEEIDASPILLAGPIDASKES